MPIFMDRHDVSDDVTAEKIAQLHQLDLKVQHEFGCRGLTYWFDPKRKSAFCLYEAPNAEAIRKMHDHAHGQVPHRVIEVDSGIVESFLGRIEDPEKSPDSELNIIDDPAFRIIMLVELKDLMPMQSDSRELRTAWQRYHEFIPKRLIALHGNLVRENRDQFLASFRSVTHAVQAALDIHKLHQHTAKENGKKRIQLKMAMSAGSPVTEKTSIFEDAIKLAERMCRIIRGNIIISAEVFDLYNAENIEDLPKNEAIFLMSTADEKFVSSLMDYTESSWSNSGLKLEDFCKSMGCSKSQFYRKMIFLTDLAPNNFIREYRLNEALTLLNKKNGNISEIAFETGFSSPSYFSKCFQKRFGHMPSDYLPVKAGV
jgi:AraC-like DNA-binding protein